MRLTYATSKGIFVAAEGSVVFIPFPSESSSNPSLKDEDDNQIIHYILNPLQKESSERYVSEEGMAITEGSDDASMRCDAAIHAAASVSSETKVQIESKIKTTKINAKANTKPPSIVTLFVNDQESYLFAAYDTKDVCCWDIKSRQLLGRKMTKKKATVLTSGTVTVHMNGELTSREVLLVADKFGEVSAIDVPNLSKAPVSCLNHTASIITDAILDDKYYITCDRDEKIRVQRFPNTLEVVSYCLGHSGCITSIAQVSKGIIISSAWDHRLILWDYAKNEILAEHSGTNDPASSMEVDEADKQQELDEKAIEDQVEVANEDVEYDEGLNDNMDDSQAGQYPFKLCKIKGLHKVEENSLATIAVIYKGSTQCEIFHIMNQEGAAGTSYEIKHHQWVPLPSLPCDMVSLDGKLIFILSKPSFIYIHDFNGTSDSELSVKQNELLHQFQTLCIDQGKIE